jgi:hypothetical protein
VSGVFADAREHGLSDGVPISIREAETAAVPVDDKDTVK